MEDEFDFTICTDEIDKYDDTVEALLRDVFGITQYIVSDMSALSDFATCCLPDNFQSDGMPYAKLEEAADDFMVAKIYELYKIKVDPCDSLVSVCQKIKSGFTSTLYH